LPKCIDYTCVKGSHSANKKISFGFNKGAKRQSKAPLVWGHRTVRCTPNSVRCTRGLQLKLATFGNFQRHSAIIHRTVRCSKEERPLELASLGKTQRLLRYNSPDCPVYTGLSGATPEQRLLRANGYLQAHSMRARSAQKSGTPILAHRTSRRAQKSELQRSNSNGIGDVAGAPDMSGVHRTVRCTIRQTSTTNGQVWWLGL
jgi:hypothetical protein